MFVFLEKYRKGEIMNETKMKAAVMTGLHQIAIREVDIPKISADDVLVQVDYVGICGSDLHYFEEGRIGDFIVECPYVLGHEVGGTVVEIGDHVHHLKIGDRVALEPQITCGKCEFCKSGRYNLCPDVEFFATPPIGGVFQEYTVHPADLCFKLPDEVSTMEGALIEPLSVGLHAAHQGNAHLGQSVVVTGTGCIGLMSLLACKAYGVSKLINTDLFDSRLQKAKDIGADYIINSRETDVVEKIKELTDGKGTDLAIDTSGSEIAINQLIQAAKPGSTIVLVGYSKTGYMNLDISSVINKELTLKSVFRYRNSYPLAIAALQSKQIDVTKIVSHIYDFADTEKAMLEASQNKEKVIKGVIRVSSADK